MVTIATHILNKYLPNKTLPTYTFLSCKQTHQTLATTVYKTGHSPLNTTISQHLVKIHLIGEQIQNISDLQSTDINTSLTTGVFPESLGRAVITPIIKKPSLDCNEFSNYRSVFNINFISKILEKVVAGQLKHYLTENKLIETYQSAYVPNKSTETALLKVQSDILNAVDSREVVFLVMLDLSVAFDTIDHGILLHCLQNNFGIAGNVLKWIKSNLESKTYQVQIDGIFSDTYDLEYGVPQGSVLGPVGFILYTSPVGNIIRKHGLKFSRVR